MGKKKLSGVTFLTHDLLETHVFQVGHVSLQTILNSHSGWSNALLLFGDNKIKMVRKPEKKLKENPVRYTGEGKI